VDSSTVLGAAVRIARREGLSLPVPVTWRFAGVPAADESSWQEQVVAELGVEDWVRVEGGDSLDFVGPIAERLIARHGIRFPANAHVHLPLIERAAGGSLLTGIGGDEILGRWRWHDRTPRSPVALARAHVPSGARRLRALRHATTRWEWLTPAAARRTRWRTTDDLTDPSSWKRRIDWQAGRRRLALGLQTLDVMGGDADVRVRCPFTAPGFLGGVARAGGHRGLGRRSEAMRALLGERVPRALEGRRDKARFGGALWTPRSDAAAAAWDGQGVDERIVDATRLHDVWRQPDPQLMTAMLLQHVVLAGAHELRPAR